MPPKEKFLYRKLYNYLFEIIKNNYNFKNFRLPSEADLSKSHSVSRITAKAAIQQLEREGLVYRVQGKGTFIANISQADIDRIEYMNAPTPEYKSTKCVGLILPDFRSKYVLDIMEGIQNEFARHDITLMIGTTNYDQSEEKRLIQSFISNKISGLIIYPVDGETYNNEILKLSMKNFPLVFIDRNLSGIKASFVHSDNYPAAYDLTSYLIENGHADIGLISLKSSNVSTIQERIAGHCDALSNHGLIINKKQILTELENYDSQWEEKITAFLTNNPELTAVIALNYDLSVKTYTVLKKMGKKVPGDISVASYDNLLDDETELLEFKPTCVHKSSKDIGANAAAQILRILQDPEWQPEDIKIPLRLILRESVRKLR